MCTGLGSSCAHPASRAVSERARTAIDTRLTQSPGDERGLPHHARHGCASLLTAADVAPHVMMEILGHSQIAVTMNVYAHVVQDTQRE
ncbi:tyrosine-type recombinase/integrase [Streptomyces sp. AHU1]|uniref:tyrosine-type recombinase/integrase n=1 Tax=Streptomyces sp. AHU1 TaxID=3377215 RepID=UPI00387815C3